MTTATNFLQPLFAGQPSRGRVVGSTPGFRHIIPFYIPSSPSWSKASDFDSDIPRFESLRGCQVNGDVAHQVEQQTENLCVVGSSPTVPTKKIQCGCSAIGRGSSLKHCTVWVRIPPSAPYNREMRERSNRPPWKGVRSAMGTRVRIPFSLPKDKLC